MQIRIIRFLSVLSALPLLAGCKTPSWTHSQFSPRRAEMRSVAIMPCRYSEWLVTRQGRQDCATAENFDAVDGCIYSAMTNQLAARGWTIAAARFPQYEATSATNEWLRARHAWMQNQVSNAYAYLNANWIQYGGHGVGCPIRPEAPLLAGYTHADAVVFVNAIVVNESEDAAAARAEANASMFVFALFLNLSLGGHGHVDPGFHESPEQHTLLISLVDGVSGECLWRSRAKLAFADGASLTEAVENAFKNYPHENKVASGVSRNP